MEKKTWGGKRMGAGRPATGRKLQKIYATDEEMSILRERLAELREENKMTLQKITGQESGLVLYDDGDMLILNWSDIEGLPRLDPMGYKPLGLGEELAVDSDPQDLPDIGAWLDGEEHTLVYDRNDDYPQLAGTSGALYRVNGAYVIAPREWN